MSKENENDYIRLDHFLKRRSLVESGGQAKVMIQNGEVGVNGEIDTRRGKKLRLGDKILFEGQKLIVDASDLES